MTVNIINNSKSGNYIAGTKVFILDQINQNSTAELIGNLSNLVDDLPFGSIYTGGIKIENPYQISQDAHPVIDVYINSVGGWLSQAKSIMALLNLARAKGSIIRTTVLGMAASSASLIAIQGTPNFRIMYEQSYNMIHYGHSNIEVDRAGEVQLAAKKELEERKIFNAPYLKYTNLTQKELNKLHKTEFGCISAQDCLNKNICDWVLTTDGLFISRNTKQR